jgi:hypothetical protein
MRVVRQSMRRRRCGFVPYADAPSATPGGTRVYLPSAIVRAADDLRLIVRIQDDTRAAVRIPDDLTADTNT